jgi:hypothetical protein
MHIATVAGRHNFVLPVASPIKLMIRLVGANEEFKVQYKCYDMLIPDTHLKHKCYDAMCGVCSLLRDQ